MAKSADRLPVLDGLRAISILLVLATHMLPLGPKALQLNATAGAMGMSLFFTLSGFLITTVLLHNSDVVEFVVRRLARIVPLAYAYALFVFTIVIFQPNEVFWTASFLENYLTAHLNQHNGHFWSLCVEVQFYFAIAAVVAAAGRKAIWIVWPACLAITATRIAHGAYIDIQTHLRVDEILAGACVATLYRSSWREANGFPISTAAIAAAFWFLSSHPAMAWLQYVRPYAAALLLVSVLLQGPSVLAAALSARPLAYIADISYALYIIHPMTTWGWWNQGSPFERYLLKRPVSFAITFLMAHLSTFYWERHWREAARQWIYRRRRRKVAVSPAPAPQLQGAQEPH